MKTIIRTVSMLWAALVVTASCIGSSDSETVLYNDKAVTAFTLGTLNRYLHTTSSTGSDSIYKVTLTGSNYACYIDQIGHLIYNRDSLPVGTDVAHVLCTISTKNNGTVAIKDVASDTLRYYYSTDSIDFTTPREFRVYASDGSGYESYTVSISAHQQDGDVFQWAHVGNRSDLAALTGMRAVTLGGRMLLFGCQSGATVVYATTDGVDWQLLTPDINLPMEADAYKSVVACGDAVYMLTAGTLLRTADGSHWTAVAAAPQLKLLTAASSRELYALDADGLLVMSADGGATWTTEERDDEAALLPSTDVSYTCSGVYLADGADYVLMAGCRDTDVYPEDAIAMVWRKIVDYSAAGSTGKWVYMERTDHDMLALPAMESLTLVNYDDGILAFGGRGKGASGAEAFAQIYQSRDQGITWKRNTSYAYPDGFECSSASFAATVDQDNNLWLFCGGSGQVWRGRLNRLGWEIQD